MKSKLIVLVLTILYLNFYYIELSVAQTRSDVCTPKGNSVIAYITTENLDNMRAYYDNYYANAYPNAEQIITYDGYSSTRRFNCHGYAWHISDGGSARWIGMGSPYDNNPEYQYWQDGSYSEVSGYVPYPVKVNWASGDHSAITTTESGVLISKWNEYPLMKHAWNDSPYGTSNLKYYKLNFQINGPSVLCNSPEAFSISNTPGGAITWTNSNNTSRVSNQGSNPCNFSSVSNGSGWINASFTTACGTSFILPQKNVWAGKPEVYPQTPLAFYPNGGYNNVCNFQNFTTNMVVNGATNVTWERISANPSNTSWSQSGNNISFYFWAVNQTAVYRISASNVCGTTSYDFGFKSINCGTDPCATDYLVSPNPTSSGLITIVPNIPPPCDTYLSEPSIQEISIYDNNGTLKKTEKYGKKTGSAEINTSDLLSGVYVVVIDDGENKVRKTIIVKK